MGEVEEMFDTNTVWLVPARGSSFFPPQHHCLIPGASLSSRRKESIGLPEVDIIQTHKALDPYALFRAPISHSFVTGDA